MNKELKPLYKARSEAKAAEQRALQAYQRADQNEADAKAKVEALARMVSEQESDQAARLAELITKGAPTSTLPPTTDDTLVHKLAVEKSNLSIASKARGHLDDTYNDALRRTAAAHQAVIAKVEEIMADELCVDADELNALLDKVIQKGSALLHLAIGAETNGALKMPLKVLSAIARLDLPLIDRRHIALNLIKEGDLYRVDQKVAEREAMIRGDEPATEAAA